MSSLSDTRPQRIAAIDALRGFDMFFLTGGLALVVAGINLFYDRSPEWLVKHSTHEAWEGFAAWDLVMPLFLLGPTYLTNHPIDHLFLFRKSTK